MLTKLCKWYDGLLTSISKSLTVTLIDYEIHSVQTRFAKTEATMADCLSTMQALEG